MAAFHDPGKEPQADVNIANQPTHDHLLPTWLTDHLNHNVPILNIRRRTLYCGFLLAAVVGGVIAGAVVGTRRSEKSTQNPPSIPTRKPPPNTAFNRTGLVSIDFADGQRSFDLFVTHPDGTVARVHFQNGTWSGEIENVTIASDNAIDDSPLMAVSYEIKDQLSWRLIFVDKKDDHRYLSEAISNNRTKAWTSGALIGNQLRFATEGIGISACKNSHYYGT
jgi:hypothetical protein